MRAFVTAGLLLTLAAAGPASAQSLYGPGGLFLHPTASVPPKGQLTPSVLVLPQYNPVFRATRTWISGSLDYGLTEDLEAGLVYLKVTNWDRDASYGGFLKYRLQREGDRRPAVAVGYTHLGGGDVDSRVGFLALRKQLGSNRGRPIIAHLGVQYADEVDEISRHEFQPYAGLELGLSTRLSLIVEGRPRMRADFGTPLAITASYRLSDTWSLAATWANNGLSDSPRFGFGAGFSLGVRR